MANQKGYNNYLLNFEKGIAVLSVNRPEVRNAMNTECWQELSDFMDYADECDDIKIIIITGTGDKAFIAGADITMLQATDCVKNIKGRGKAALTKIENSTKPVIAAINGVAFGGGFEVALACDIRIVSENAKLGLPETGLGILPGAGGTQRLSRLVGIGIAKEVILGGRIIDAAEAYTLGLAMKCTAPENLIDECMNVANTMMSKGPLALNLAKKAINISLDTDKNTGLLLEKLAFSILLSSEDKNEGLTAFLEKRRPIYTGN